MPLAWSLGIPMAIVENRACAQVFDILYGPDGDDPNVWSIHIV